MSAPMAPASTGDVLIRVADGICWITINRPQVANALGRAQYRAIRGALVAADDDPAVQVVVLNAEGRHFCAGGDLADLQNVFSQPRAYIDEAFAFYRQFVTMRKLVVASVHGGVFTVGAIAVAGCDMVVASDNSYMSLPEIEIGLWEPYTVSLLSASIGVKRTKRMLLTGERVPAATLQEWGLYDHVVPDSELRSRTEELAHRLVATSPQARLAYKAMCNSLLPEWDIRIPINCLDSADSAAGVAAFNAKQPPYWKEADYWVDSTSGP